MGQDVDEEGRGGREWGRRPPVLTAAHLYRIMRVETRGADAFVTIHWMCQRRVEEEKAHTSFSEKPTLTQHGLRAPRHLSNSVVSCAWPAEPPPPPDEPHRGTNGERLCQPTRLPGSTARGRGTTGLPTVPSSPRRRMFGTAGGTQRTNIIKKGGVEQN